MGDTRKSNREQEILQTAIEMFAEVGYHGVKTSEIAKRAGISLGLMYHYFADKQALYNSAVAFCLAAFRARIAEFSAAESGEPLAYFQGLSAYVVHRFAQHPLEAMMYLFLRGVNSRSPLLSDAVRAGIEAVNAQTLAATLARVEAGQRAGLFKDGNPAALAKMFWGALESAIRLIAGGQGGDLPDERWLLEILLRR